MINTLTIVPGDIRLQILRISPRAFCRDNRWGKRQESTAKSPNPSRSSPLYNINLPVDASGAGSIVGRGVFSTMVIDQERPGPRWVRRVNGEDRTTVGSKP